MPLTVGTQIGSHEITALLGKGGMGEVYRARDLKLKREVAIKVLPDEVAADAERLSRFQREAEVLASLNHPNIAAIYDIQEIGASRFIVLELVEGETLAERIERGPIPLDEALRIAASIGEALEAAHEKGIVHRDLKPANVKVTPDGKVKVLDFGLAKTAEGAVSTPALSNSPTKMTMATNAGILLGTAAYMSPEQARGSAVDKRADIWAFGVVLYEMLTGSSPFAGPTVSDTLALVLTRELDLSAVPERVRLLLQRCTERDLRKRLRDIGDATLLLEATSSSAAAIAVPPSKRIPVALAAIALVSSVAASVLAFVHFRTHPESVRAVQFQIPAEGVLSALTISPDGRYLSFTSPEPDKDRRVMLIRALDSSQNRQVADASATRPSWSPDSKWLLFVSGPKLQRVAVEGGAIETVLETEATPLRFPHWTSSKYVYEARAGEFMEVPLSGGQPRQFLSVAGLLNLVFIQDDRHLLFSAGDASVPGTTLGIFAASAESAQSQVSQWQTSRPLVTTDDLNFSFAPLPDGRRGYIFFMRDGALLAQAFDSEKLEISGSALTIATDVSNFAVSQDVLAYRAGRAGSGNSQLRWFDRKGNQVGIMGEPANVGDMSLSRDGKTVLIDRVDSGANRVWLGDATRGVFIRVTSENGNETAGAITPDGSTIFTEGNLRASGDLYIMRSNSASPELLTKSEFIKHTNDVSADGKYLIYDVHGRQLQDLWILPLSAGGNAKPVPFLVTAADETFGQFSPDGKWVAYRSTESGRAEVYVRAFLPDQNPASSAKKWLVSTGGGDKPRWSRDGKELFYIAPNRKMMATPVKTGATFEPGIPVALFDVQSKGYFPYDVSADGRFLINTPGASTQATSSPITVIVNWASKFGISK